MIMYTAQQLADRFIDLREVENLAGKYVFDIMICKEADLYKNFWTRTKPDVALGMNNGWYRGAEAIDGYYQAVAKQTVARSEAMRADFPGELGSLSDEELYGVGRLNLRPLTNPIVEIAGDGQTAKGLWQVMGIDNEPTLHGPLSTWRWGWMGADFVCEDGEWKIWHLLTVDDFFTPVGSDWADPEKPPILPDYAFLRDLELPAPTEARTLFSVYTPDRPFTPPLPAPVPYQTFADTFSYAE